MAISQVLWKLLNNRRCSWHTTTGACEDPVRILNNTTESRSAEVARTAMTASVILHPGNHEIMLDQMLTWYIKTGTLNGHWASNPADLPNLLGVFAENGVSVP